MLTDILKDHVPFTVLSIVIIEFHSVLINSYKVDSGRDKLMAVSVLFSLVLGMSELTLGNSPINIFRDIYSKIGYQVEDK